MNVIFLLPSRSEHEARFKAVAAALRDGAHRTIMVNPARHRSEETYRGVMFVVGPKGWTAEYPQVALDYEWAAAHIVESDETAEALTARLLGGAPKEASVAEGLPTAPPITNTPSGTLEGLPPITGDDAGEGEGLIIRSEGRRSR